MYADVFESWKYMFLRRSLAQYKYIYFFVGTFRGLAPLQYQKAGYATASPRSVTSLPRIGPPLTNPDCTTVTGIAKGHKRPPPPPPRLLE